MMFETQTVSASTGEEINIVKTPDIIPGFSEQYLLQEQLTNKSNLVKEHSFSLNLLNVTKIEHTTTLINGILKGLIIESNKIVGVKIYLKNHPGIIIFETRQIQGDTYIPLKIQSMTNEHKIFTFSSDEFVLNDNLVFEVEGSIDSEVKFSVRWI